jgi:hypothetical protein
MAVDLGRVLDFQTRRFAMEIDTSQFTEEHWKFVVAAIKASAIHAADVRNRGINDIPNKVYYREVQKQFGDARRADELTNKFQAAGWISRGNSMFCQLSNEFVALAEAPATK